MAGQPFDPGFIRDVRERTSLVELIAPTVALKRAGHDLRGLCPFHQERTASFYVIERKGFWYCFGCGAQGDAIAWIRRTTDAGFAEAVEWLAARAGLRADRPPEPNAKPIVRRPAADMLAVERRTKIAGAQRIWHQARPIAGSLAARYLAKARNIRVELPPSLRFVPALAHPYLRHHPGFPALIGAVQGIEGANERALVGVHCTYLAPDGAGKAPAPAGFGGDWRPKIMRGAVWGGAVRLTHPEPLMVIAEGIETALSALQLLYDPDQGCAHIEGETVGVWAALSLGNMGALWLPAMVREVVLAADNDGKIPAVAAAGQPDPEELLDAVAERHLDQGRAVRIADTPVIGDFNDLLPAGAGYAAVGG